MLGECSRKDMVRFVFIFRYREKLPCRSRVQESFIATKGVERPQTVHVRALSRRRFAGQLPVKDSVFDVLDL